jgi:glycosyltransferase A (GT-A) superfamily protein (DUF2064 family)
VLVVAKAPVTGQVKTRLGATIGMEQAARVAAAALLDTMATCRDGFGPGRCVLSLSGDLAAAVRGPELVRAAAGWTVTPQRGRNLAERLGNAHADLPAGGAVVQVGMDTPQVTSAMLHDALGCLDSHEAVLGRAHDGGWWVLGLRNPQSAQALRDVRMSQPTTYDDTRRALNAVGLGVARTADLRDVDRATDAEAVAKQAPDGEFARTWAVVR